MLTSVPAEEPYERPPIDSVDDVFGYIRGLVGSVEPAIVFSSLTALCVPSFSDFCSVDIVEGGRVRYRIAAPRPQPGTPARARELFEVRTTFDSALDGWAPYSGVMVNSWRSYQPNDADEARAARVVGQAIRAIRDERLADPMQPMIAPTATFQRARARR